MREKITYDRAFENKLMRAEAASAIRTDNEVLILHVRRSDLFARCANDVAIYRSVLDVLEDRQLIDDAVLDEAYARAQERAAAYPFAPPARKLEGLRLELLSEPSPALAALLEADGFNCISRQGCHPIVYYGKGVLADYKKRVRSPDVVAASPLADGVVLDRKLGTDEPPAGQQAAREAPPAGAADPGESDQVSQKSAPRFRIDKSLDTPVITGKLIRIVETLGPLDAVAVIEALRAEAGQSRLREATKGRIVEHLDALVAGRHLGKGDDGRYGLPTASSPAGTPDVTEAPPSQADGSIATSAAPDPQPGSTELRPLRNPVRAGATPVGWPAKEVPPPDDGVAVVSRAAESDVADSDNTETMPPTD